MNALRLSGPAPDPHRLIEDAIEAHGAIRVLLVAAAAALRRRNAPRPRPPDVDSLNAHILRDIGLRAEPEAVDWRLYLR